MTCGSLYIHIYAYSAGYAMTLMWRLCSDVHDVIFFSVYEYVHVLQPDESGRGVIMSDNYPFMYQKRQYRYVIDAGNTSSQVCFK